MTSSKWMILCTFFTYSTLLRNTFFLFVYVSCDILIFTFISFLIIILIHFLLSFSSNIYRNLIFMSQHNIKTFFCTRTSRNRDIRWNSETIKINQDQWKFQCAFKRFRVEIEFIVHRIHFFTRNFCICFKNCLC